jgi:hypothetical protein
VGRVAAFPVLATVLAAAIVAVPVTLAAAPPKNQPSTIYVDQSGGYRITVPRTWQVMPPSVAAVKQTITRLEKQKKTELAAFYSDQIKTAAGRKELSTFRFRAFRWPLLPSPVPTDVSLSITPIAKKYKQADLPAIGASFAKNLRTPGATVAAPEMLKLKAGPAALITGTVPLPKPYTGVKTGFSLVLLLRPGKLYMLSFRIDSAVASQAKVFAAITSLFRFCPASGSCT